MLLRSAVQLETRKDRMEMRGEFNYPRCTSDLRLPPRRYNEISSLILYPSSHQRQRTPTSFCFSCCSQWPHSFHFSLRSKGKSLESGLSLSSLSLDRCLDCFTSCITGETEVNLSPALDVNGYLSTDPEHRQSSETKPCLRLAMEIEQQSRNDGNASPVKVFPRLFEMSTKIFVLLLLGVRGQWRPWIDRSVA